MKSNNLIEICSVFFQVPVIFQWMCFSTCSSVTSVLVRNTVLYGDVFQYTWHCQKFFEAFRSWLLVVWQWLSGKFNSHSHLFQIFLKCLEIKTLTNNLSYDSHLKETNFLDDVWTQQWLKKYWGSVHILFINYVYFCVKQNLQPLLIAFLITENYRVHGTSQVVGFFCFLAFLF